MQHDHTAVSRSLETPAALAQPDYPSTTQVRIYTFGPLHIEWVDQHTGCADAVPKENLAIKDATPALWLLKLLLSQPHRFALRDEIMELFWPEVSSTSAAKRLDNVVYALRKLLRPPGSTQVLHLRQGTSANGNGYQLANYPHIWVDADAFTWNIEQAARMERFGEESLSLWEAASHLAARGMYLAEERYSEWAMQRRASLEGQYRQCVHRLAALYRQHGHRSPAELRLRTYWQTYPTDEDALRPLLELLGEQERYQEAEACYQQFLGALQEEGRDPDPRTQDVAEYLRAKQIQRERVATDSGKAAESIAPPLATPSHMQQDGYPALPSAITQGIIEAVRQGITVATQQQLERPFMDSIRRNLIQGLITPTAIIGLKRDIFPFFSSSQNPERLMSFQQELATRWEVYHTGETRLAYQGLDIWIGDVTAFTHDSKGDMLYKQILECLCMSFQLQGSLYRDMMEFDEAHTSYHKAFEIAKEMEKAEYQACALARRGVGFIQQEMPDEAVAYLNEALRCIQRSFLPSLSGYIFQALSEAHAMAQHDYESQCNIEQAQKALEHRGQAIERSLCQPNTTSVISQQGVNAVLLRKDSEALELIGKGLEKYSPALNRGRARLKAQKAEAYYGLGLIDLCCTEATETWLLARSIGSNKTLARLRKVHLNLVLSRRKKEQSVLDLGWVIANM